MAKQAWLRGMLVGAWVVLGVTLCCGIVAAAPRESVRTRLIGDMNGFVAAMTTPGMALPRLASHARITENGADIGLADSQLRKLKSITYRQTFVDPTTGEAGFYGAGGERDRGVVFSIRLKIGAKGITEVETVVTHEGEASVFAGDKMTAPSPEYDAIVPPVARSDRATMIAAANAYFDGIERADGSLVPAAATCNRVENGVQTTNRSADSKGCKDGLKNLTYIKHVRERRFPIVEEARGLVWGLVVFDIPGGLSPSTVNGQIVQRQHDPRSILINELFKISGGQIQDIAVVMRNTPLGGKSGWTQ